MKKIIISFAVFSLLFTGCTTKEKDVTLNLIEQTIEYGSTPKTELEDYVLLEETDEINQEEVELTLPFQTDDILAVGTYNIKIKYQSKEYETNLNVVDTTAPEFSEYKTDLTYEENDKPDYNEVFKATDLSKTTVEYNEENIDYSKEGSYKLIVTAKDDYDNKKTLEANINIVAKPTEVANTNTPNTTTTKNTNNTTQTSTQQKTEAKTETQTQQTQAPVQAKAQVVQVAHIISVDRQEAMVAFELQNDIRSANGVARLQWDEQIYNFALTRAKELPTKFDGSHTRPDGRSFSSVFKDAGYSYRTVGENTGGGYRSAARVVEGWKNSQGHFRNMVHSDYTKGAIAKIYVENDANGYYYYWAANFAG